MPKRFATVALARRACEATGISVSCSSSIWKACQMMKARVGAQNTFENWGCAKLALEWEGRGDRGLCSWRLREEVR